MTLRAVLFDAGNTLVFLEYPRLAAAVGEAVGRPLSAAGLEAQASAAAARLEDGRVTDRERATRYLEALFVLAGVPEADLPVVRETLRLLHAERHLWSGVHPDTPAALARLRAAGLPLAVVSNSDGKVDGALRELGLRDYFDVVIDSAHVGVEKPDPRIFHLALAQLGASAAESLYVGDLYEVDVVGARAAGLPVVLVDPHGRHAGRDVPTVPHVAALVTQLLAGDGAGPSLTGLRHVA